MLERLCVLIPLSFPVTDTHHRQAHGGNQRRPGLQRHTGRSWDVTVELLRVSAPQSHRPLIKEWFIEASQRDPLCNPSTEWDFSSGRGRVNQTWRRKACKAQRSGSVIKCYNLLSLLRPQLGFTVSPPKTLKSLYSWSCLQKTHLISGCYKAEELFGLWKIQSKQNSV